MEVSLAEAGNESNSYQSVDTFEKTFGDSLQVSEHQEVHTTPRLLPVTDRRRRRQLHGTVVWEPLLVPSEVDGKVEMVTALKRVDSDYISNPRPTQRMSGAQILKESATQKLKVQQTHTNPTKVVLCKGTTESSVKHNITKKKITDVNINEQMERAIAEKEAAILKEIEKAMKEANAKTRSISQPEQSVSWKNISIPSEQSKPNTSLKVAPNENVIKKNVDSTEDSISIHPDLTKDTKDSINLIDDVSDGEKHDASFILSPRNINKPAKTKIQTIQAMLKSEISPSALAKDVHGLKTKLTGSGKLAAVSSTARSLTKESQSVSKVMAGSRAVVASVPSSTVVTVPKDKVVGATLSPTSTAVISAQDIHAVNQLFTVPIKTKSNPRSLKDVSSTAPTILLLAAPTSALADGSVPLLTPFIPGTNIPIIRTPLQASSRSVSKGKVDIHELLKGTAKRARKTKNLGARDLEASTEDLDSESGTFESSDVHIRGIAHSVKTVLADSNKKINDSNRIHLDNAQGLSAQSDIKKLSKRKAQSPLRTFPKEWKNYLDESLSGKDALNVPHSESETVKLADTRGRLKKANTASGIAMNGKTAGKNRNTQQSFSVVGKDTLRMNYNGESMDIDDECISVDLDQESDTRTVNYEGSVVSGEAKDNSYAKRNKNKAKEKTSPKTSLKTSPKTSPKTKNSAQNKSVNLDSSDVSMESRLQRYEQLCNELPPRRPRFSLCEDDFSKIRDGFRDTLHVIMGVSTSVKSFINQSSSLGSKRFVHSSCQTEVVVDADITDDVKNIILNDKPEECHQDMDVILCRLCGVCVKENSVILLFGTASKEKKLLSMLSTILPQTSVKESDSLPQHVCEACVNKLIKCHSIIIQFLQADKELRQVMKNEKLCTSEEILNTEENEGPVSQESQDTPEENPSTSKDDNLHSEPFGLDTRSDEKPIKDEEAADAKPNKKPNKAAEETVQSSIEQRTLKRKQTLTDSERSCTANTISNQGSKRRRSKSPPGSGSDDTTKSSGPSACIDLSRLDPEFDNGFEVEWCLDEDTIRSSLITEDDVGQDSKEDLPVAAAPACVTEGTPVESEVHEDAPIPSGESASSPSSNSEKKTKDDQENRGSKLTVEVSKLPEMHSSVCESPVQSGTKHKPASAVHQEKCDVQPNIVTQLRETFKCPSCPLSFCSKREAFLHRVMQHDEELAINQDSTSAVKIKKLPQKQSISPDVKIESEHNEELIMCDQCGLPFPNEFSLNLHNCIIRETPVDPQLVTLGSKGLELKIINSKPALVENEPCEEVAESALTEGKILVKCGQGMLWVNCSKFFSEAQVAAIQASDVSGMTYVNVENESVNISPSEQTVVNVAPHSAPKVQFAYKCDHCKKIFPGKSDLLTHLETHLTEKYNCNECNAKFRTIKALNSHIPTHVPPDRVCDECGLILPDSKKLIQHRKEHTHNLPHMCETCGKKFPNEQTLEVHETVHYSKKGPLACSLCRKCFFFKHSLVRHRSQHASNRLQKCSLCFRVLNSSDQLRKHVALHHLMRNFVCFCKQTFPRQRELVEHRYLKHSYAEIFCARNKVEIVESLPLHQCSTCLRVLNSKQNLLKHHVASHPSTWPFYCIQCSRKYKSMSHLAKHECHRKNTSAFQCRICGKAFQNKNIFNQHKVIHNNRKWRYICRHCGKAFQKSQSLVSHIMSHGGKRFLCPRCHQPCQNKEGLLKHYNTGSCQMKGKSVK